MANRAGYATSALLPRWGPVCGEARGKHRNANGVKSGLASVTRSNRKSYCQSITSNNGQSGGRRRIELTLTLPRSGSRVRIPSPAPDFFGKMAKFDKSPLTSGLFVFCDRVPAFGRRPVGRRALSHYLANLLVVAAKAMLSQGRHGMDLTPAASHRPSGACRRCAAAVPAPWRHRRAPPGRRSHGRLRRERRP